jgi:AcrR family transcriptional regulator
MSTVARPERTRLLEAMLEELVEKGYPALEVEDAVHRARLSGAEWSSRFPNKDVCLVEAFEELADQLRTAIGRGCMTGESWTERVAGGLRVLLAELARRASMAEALARTFPSIGPTAVIHYQAFVESLAPLLAPGRELAAGVELPGEVEVLAVGAVEAIVMERIQAGETASLPELGPEILFSLLVPFVGPGAASEAMEAERARPADGGGRPAPA